VTDAPPANYPARWEADVVLVDGGTAHVRPIRPDDAARILRFHARQSERSIYFRYLSPRPRLTDRELVRLTTVDYLDRMAFVALLGDDIVGIARYDRPVDQESAEVAFFVDDAHQGRGIATLLLEYLATAARENGIPGLVATTLPENTGMIQVFSRAGFEVRTRFAGGVVEVSLGIDPTPSGDATIAERARRAEARSVHRLLRPTSIAVIGASREPGTVGHEVFRALLAGGFAGPVYPVNRAAGHVAAVRAYATVEDVPDDVDLAVVAVPAAEVPATVASCGRHGVGGLVVLSTGSGDDELGATGRRELVELARRHGMRLIGPGSLGVLDTDPEVSLSATLATAVVRPGRVALSAQSGSLAAAILDLAVEMDVGLSSFVSLGAKADVSGNDLLSYWEQDPRTAVVCLYLESFGNPRRFFRIARRVAGTKPVLAMHTAYGPAADGTWPDARTTSALLAQAGVIEVSSLAEMFDVARFCERAPIPTGRRVAVLANAAEVLELTVGAALAAGLVVPSGPGSGTVVDLGVAAEAADYRRALGDLLARDDVDAAVVVHAPPVPQRSDEVAAAIDELAAANGKPVVATVLGASGPSHAVPRYRFPEEAVRALAHAAGLGVWRAEVARAAAATPPPRLLDADRRTAVAAFVSELADRGASDGVVGRDDSIRLLELLGLRFEPGAIAPPGGVEAQVVGRRDDALGGIVALGRGGLAGDMLGDLAVRLAPLGPPDVDALLDVASVGVVLGRLPDPDAQRARGHLDRVVRVLGELVDMAPACVQVRLDPVVLGTDDAIVGGAAVMVRPSARRRDDRPDVRRLDG